MCFVLVGISVTSISELMLVGFATDNSASWHLCALCLFLFPHRKCAVTSITLLKLVGLRLTIVIASARQQ